MGLGERAVGDHPLAVPDPDARSRRRRVERGGAQVRTVVRQLPGEADGLAHRVPQGLLAGGAPARLVVVAEQQVRAGLRVGRG